MVQGDKKEQFCKFIREKKLILCYHKSSESQRNGFAAKAELLSDLPLLGGRRNRDGRSPSLYIAPSGGVTDESGGMMAISFCRASKISRTASGRSAVAAAAYRAGEKLHDKESGENWKYKKDEVVYSKITLPENAPREFADRETLWNSVQEAEKQSNAMLARELVIALPNELSQEQAQKLIDGYSKYLAKKGMCVDANIHWKDGNHHAHLMLTTRKLDKDGKWAKWKERKEFARDEEGNKIPLLDKNGNQKVRVREGKGVEKLWKRVSVQENEWSKKSSLNEWKKELAGMMNRELQEIGINEKIDYRSYEEQGKVLIPQVHEGYAARAIEKRGGKSFLCEENRKIRAINKNFLEKVNGIDEKIAGLEKQKADRDKVTICGFEGLDLAQRKAVSKRVLPILNGLERAYRNQFIDSKGQFRFKEDFVRNAVFAKTKDGVHLLNINKKDAMKCGLLGKAGKAKDLTIGQLKEAGKNVKAVGKAVQSLFDENTTAKQHLKNAKDNVIEIFKTPPQAVFDIIKNPVTGILSLPTKIFSMISNAAEASLNLMGAVAKGANEASSGGVPGGGGGGGGIGPEWYLMSPEERAEYIERMQKKKWELHPPTPKAPPLQNNSWSK